MASQPLTEGSLDGPETYHAWYAMINATIPRDLWKYVDPEMENEFEEPEEITFDSIRPGATTLRELTAAEKTQYANLRKFIKTILPNTNDTSPKRPSFEPRSSVL